MDIFMSGEIDAKISEEYSKISNEIEVKLKVLQGKDYGYALKSIGIIPICVNLTKEIEEAGFYKERKLFKRKERDADYRLRIDYEKFQNGNDDVKRLLIVKNIIDSIKLLGTKIKDGFDSKKLEDDILNLLKIDSCDLENL
jgi:hypothetical protein